MGSFKYNGISSEDLGLVIQTPPSYEFPERDVSSTHVPGRNGDLIIDNKCYKNVSRTYSIAKAYDRGTNYYANSEAILKWLTSANGKYVRLEDSYDSEVYRLATFTMSGSFTNYFDKAGAISVTFECKPQRFFTVGEKETKYVGNETSIINNYGYTTKPKITINNIPTDLEDILMLTIKDKDEITSSVTLTRIPNGTAILDSEDESVFDKDGNNISHLISLNGKGFPKLNAGKNTFLFEKYEQERSILSPYTTIIAENQEVCTIKYTPYIALEDATQKKIKVTAFEELKEKYAESYYADAVQTYVNEVSEEFTFISFNTIMSNNGESVSFTGTEEDNDGTFPDWLIATYGKDSSGKDVVSISAGIDGYYICTNSEKKITFRRKNETIASDLSISSIVTVNYYKAIVDKDTQQILKQLDITYDNLPEYLNFKIVYDKNEEATSGDSPTNIIYQGTEEEGGYYWTDKTWIFGKAGWQYSSPETLPRDFTTLNWNTSKKAFVSSGPFSSNTTASFTYRYIKELPQYSDIVETSVNDDGRKVTTVKSKCRFLIEDRGSKSGEEDTRKIEKIVVKVKDTEDNGYYAYALNDGDISSYTYRTKGLAIIDILNGTDAFEVYYLKEIPTYIDEDGWDSELFDPESINPDTLEKSGINDNVIGFKVNKHGLYRFSYIADDGTEQYTDWLELNAGDAMSYKENNIVKVMSKSSTETFYMCEIDEIPPTYDFDRSYNDSAIVPDYIRVTYYSDSEMGTEITKADYDNMTSEEKAKVTIKYTAAKDGYFKWDSNNNWQRKSAGDDLLICNLKDDAVIYYLSEIPNYEDYDLSDLFHMNPTTDSEGNPTQVEYIVDEAGYYKFNNATDWKYYNKDEQMYIASINSTNTVYHLKKKEDTLENIEMVVIPRWWSL